MKRDQDVMEGYSLRSFSGDVTIDAFHRVRRVSEQLISPLTEEDCNIQSVPEVSPPKWHLAHTTWFFEKFVLQPFLESYEVFHPRYDYLFNSYYETEGSFHPRPLRGVLSRPSLPEVMEYRRHVDDGMRALWSELSIAGHEALQLILLGMAHEQQHQELILMDVKRNFSLNPLRPVYRESKVATLANAHGPRMEFKTFHAQPAEIGHGGDGFAFDNESPRHSVYIRGFRLGTRLVTNFEYLQFIDEGGYRRPELWLSDGWDLVKKGDLFAPLYWERDKECGWKVMTLSGLTPLHVHEPVSHVSYYEADAYARWAGKRLPTEQEWELAAIGQPVTGNFLESGRMHPVIATGETPISQLWGDLWEWTSSPYGPYPGYRAPAGALAEYNGKFMVNQMVLRGGSAVTPASHIRPTYRNFYPPASRWQFSGIRLAEDL